MTQATVTFNAYKDGVRLLGTTQIDLPSLAAMTSEIKGSGIAGAIDMPIKGFFQSMTTTVNWRTITADQPTVLTPESHHIEFWAAVQVPDSVTGKLGVKQHKFIIKGVPKTITPGKLGIGETQDRTTEYELTYYKEVFDGKTVVEIDKLNHVFVVNGEDQLSELRDAIGLS